MKKHSSSPLLISLAVFFAYLTLGYVENLKGPSMPYVISDLNFSYATSGNILLAASIGFALATFFGGFLFELTGRKTVIFISAICLTVGILTYSLFSDVVLLFIGMFFIGLGMGSILLGGSAIIADIHDAKKGRYLSLLNVCYGIGAMSVPYVSGSLLVSGVSWRVTFQISLVLVAVLVVFFLLLRYPARPVLVASKNFKGFFTLFRAALSRKMAWFYVMICAHCTAEVAVATWMVSYLKDVKGMEPYMASIYLTIYFACLTVGRLVGSFVIDRLKYIVVLAFSFAGAVVTLALGTCLPAAFAFILPLTGLFFSSVFPATTATVSRINSEAGGSALGVLFTFSSTGVMLGSWIVGILGDAIGLNYAFLSVVLFELVAVVAAVFVYRMLSRTARNVPGQAAEQKS